MIVGFLQYAQCPKPPKPSLPTATSSAQPVWHFRVSLPLTVGTEIATDDPTDDSRVLLAARQEARQKFETHRREGVDTPMQLKHAQEVADILRHNLVQGAREAEDENAKWRMFIPVDMNWS